jgi:hypothetical protein
MRGNAGKRNRKRWLWVSAVIERFSVTIGKVAAKFDYDLVTIQS